MKKRLMSIMLAAVVAVMTTAPGFCYAAGPDFSITKIETSFTKDWEKVAYGDGGKAKIIYGFNKGLISTDYIRGYHTKKGHAVGIDRKYTRHKKPGRVARLTRIHKEKLVLFGMDY